MKSFFGLLLLCGLQIACPADVSSDDALKMDYLRHVTKCMRPHEWADQAYWATNWRVAAVFFDLNRDGRCDALVSTPDQQSDSRFDWLPMQKTDGGEIFIEYYDRTHVSVMCSPVAIYRATLSGGQSLLLGRDCSIDKYEEGKRIWFKHPYDLIFRTDTGGRLAPLLDPFMIDKAVSNPDFVRLEREMPEWYLGYDLKPAPPDKEYILSDKANLPNGGVASPVGFDSFVRQYREDVKRRLGLTRPVAVYAVFFDADLDGDVDCYVSSDAESAGAGRYRWTLFLNDAHEMRKAKERVWCNRGTIKDVAMLEPEDVAGKDSFYRVVRTHGPAQILVMESDGKRLHTHAYTHLLSEEDRRKCPPRNKYQLKAGQQSFDDWEGEMRDKYGFMPPMDFRDQVAWLFFHHLERLPCEDFPEY